MASPSGKPAKGKYKMSGITTVAEVDKAMVYAVRILKNKQWHVGCYYHAYEAAEFFASNMLSGSIWDIKPMTLEGANQLG